MTKAQRWTQAAIAGLMGLYLIYSLLSGNIANYIALKYSWLTWTAAGILLVLSVTQAVTLIRPALSGHDDDHHAHDHHDHAHEAAHSLRTWLGLGIVALPVLFGLLIPSKPLTSRAVDKPVASDLSSINAAPSDVRLSLAPLDRNVLDWISAFVTAPDPSVFNGQPADVVGFVYRDARFDRPDQFMVARFIMSCCAADAQAIGLIVEWPGAESLRDDTWVRVRGTVEVAEWGGALLPHIMAHDGESGVERLDQPQNPYLYP
jgi:uncharacterized repeat protein (TIGR03943 family)